MKKSSRQEKFEREQFWSRINLGIGLSVGTVACAVVFILFGGEYTKGARDYFGLSSFLPDETGVYADCSKRSNSNNKFCRRDYSSVRNPPPKEPLWHRPDSGIPFTLYDTDEKK